MNAVMVRVAYAQPQLGTAMSDEPQVDVWPRGRRQRGFLVVLADDAGHRALSAWVAEEPDGISLPDLLDRPADDIWTTASAPEELTVRLTEAAGGNVTGVEIYPVTAEPGEVNADTCAARVELGSRHVTARLGQGLRLAVVAGAPVRVDGAVMDRLAVPVPADDPAAPFRSPPHGQGHVIIARREGHVLHVPVQTFGERPRFEPQNMAFTDGFDRWHVENPSEYFVVAENSMAILSSAVPEPSGSGALLQALLDAGPEQTTDGLTARVLRALGATVTEVEIGELGPEVAAARIGLTGPAGARHVTVRLVDGLAIAIAAGAPVRVADTVMNQLAVRAGTTPVLEVGGALEMEAALEAGGAGGPRDRPGGPVPRRSRRRGYSPRNVTFAEGLDGWMFGGSFTENVSDSHWHDYACDADGGTAGNGSGWAAHQVAARVPADGDAVVFGIFLAGHGRIELRNPELRRA